MILVRVIQVITKCNAILYNVGGLSGYCDANCIERKCYITLAIGRYITLASYVTLASC